MTAPLEHVSVMPAEVMEALAPQDGEFAVDGTLGLAGHAKALGHAVGASGRLVGIDWDEAMLAEARSALAGQPAPFRLFHGDYRRLPEFVSDAARGWGIAPNPHAILLDLGLNNAQIEDAARGISFLREGPLDMRMDRSAGLTAAEWLNRAREQDIADALRTYAQEKWAARIAQFIVQRRPLATTQDLVEAVQAAIPVAARDKRIHPATRTFQAVRIAVNGELDELEACIEAAARTLAPGGRFAVLSYHSEEDRPVKTVFRRLAKTEDFEAWKKPLAPSAEEVAANPKSRSAKLRLLRRKTQEEIESK
jgi:16S rRNA (cytosine1402-N4)-methyltransferase